MHEAARRSCPWPCSQASSSKQTRCACWCGYCAVAALSAVFCSNICCSLSGAASAAAPPAAAPAVTRHHEHCDAATCLLPPAVLARAADARVHHLSHGSVGSADAGDESRCPFLAALRTPPMAKMPWLKRVQLQARTGPAAPHSTACLVPSSSMYSR